MNKSVYSIVLQDTIVSEIDKLAYKNSTNRSNMINQILAEYVSLITPEKKVHDIFDTMISLFDLDTNYKLPFKPSDSMISLRSALSYKYNPTVRYSVELYRDISNGIGELRVSLRTQNSNLIMYMMEFYRLWSDIEQKYIGGSDCSIYEGKFIRTLNPRINSNSQADLSSSDIGQLIFNYINIFDNALKSYFNNISDSDTAIKSVNMIYKNYIQSCREII